MLKRPPHAPRITLPEHPRWVELYELAWRIALDNIERPEAPSWTPIITCMPAAGLLWAWDSCFISLFARYAGRDLPALSNLDNLYRCQGEDGYISMAYRMADSAPAYGERINPPLFAWAEWEHYQVTGDDSRLGQVLPRLIKLFDWIQAHRRRPSGLYWFEDSGSSGMDNAPRSGYCAEHLDGSDVCFVDLASQQALAARCIAHIAGHQGDAQTVARFERAHAELADLVNRMHWCKRTAFYYDLFARSNPADRHNFVNHKTVAGFWPLLAGIASDRQCDKLVEHLFNRREFWTSHPVPSLSRDDPNYDRLGGYWRGGVWAPTNYMIARGLVAYGRHREARRLAMRHLDKMARVMDDEKWPGIWECYSPEAVRPASNGRGELVRPNFVGWSGLGPVAMLIENVLGLELNATANRITWRLAGAGERGIENLCFNGGTVALHAAAGRKGQWHLLCETEKSLELALAEADGKVTACRSLSAGRSEFVI